MIKLSIRFFLSLCIFLVSGYSQLYAHTCQLSAFHSKLNHIQEADLSCSLSLQYEQALIMESPSSGTEKNFIKEVTEIELREEEEESFSFKKHIKCCNYYSTLFNALLPETYFLYYKNRLSFFKHFTTHRTLYLIFRVFRL